MTDAFLVSPNERDFLAGAGDRMPLGLLNIATNLRDNGHSVKVYDLNHTPEDTFLDDVERDKPKAIGYSVISSPSYNKMSELMLTTKIMHPDITSVVGGYHALARPNDFLRADYVIRGDGEQAMVDILEGREPSKEIQRIDVNDIAFPDKEFLNPNLYRMKQNGKKTSSIYSSRGCPFSCVFCGNYDRKVRFREPDNIRSELEQLTNMGFESLYFLDDAFTLSTKHAKNISDVAKEFDMPFRITTRADLLDEQTIKYMSERGLEIASLGIESGDDDVLKNVGKRMTTADNERAVEMLHKYGVDVKGFFMFGLPGEGPKEATKTIDFSLRLREKGLTSADFYAMTPFPGTPIYEDPLKHGVRILNEDWDKYLEVGKRSTLPVAETSTLSAEQIQLLVNKAKRQWK